MEATFKAVLNELAQPLAAIRQSSLCSLIPLFIQMYSNRKDVPVIELRQLRYFSIYLKKLRDPDSSSLLSLLLQALQIIMCNPMNRRLLQQDASLIDISVMKLELSPDTPSVLHEVLRLVTILCYEVTNVPPCLARGLLPLIFAIWRRSSDDLILIDVLSLLQAVCCCRAGRLQLQAHEERVFVHLTSYLSSEHPQICARAAGIFHNLSIEGSLLRALRESGLIPVLGELLTIPDRDTVRAVVGTVQNMSREHQSRRIMLEQPELVPRIVHLVFGTDLSSQTAAAGALLNLLGPSLSSAELDSLRAFLSDGIALGVIRSSLFDVG